jgi:hypothetical protein
MIESAVDIVALLQIGIEPSIKDRKAGALRNAYLQRIAEEILRVGKLSGTRCLHQNAIVFTISTANVVSARARIRASASFCGT